MAKLYGALRGSQLASAIAGDGVEWTSDDILGLDLKATSGLSIDTAELKLDLNNLGAEVLAVATDSIAFIDSDDSVTKKESVADFIASVASTGLTASAGTLTIGATQIVDSMINDDVATGLAGGLGLEATDGVMRFAPNTFTEEVVDVTVDKLMFYDATDSLPKLEAISDIVTAMAGSGLTATAGVLSVDAITANVVESDFVKEDESANANGSNVEFTLGSSPLSATIQLFLNGQLMIEGSGKNYTISGTTITFATAPASGDTVTVYYVIDN